ncbi:MAG: nucleotidyl transferase AbiEii/AbiGii toxin family protein [bacterium]
MSNLFFETITKEQKEIFESLPSLEPKGVLGGGTAIALQIGHRKSVDLDVFLEKEVPKILASKVNAKFTKFNITPIVDNANELTLTVGKTKLTFVCYPFPPLHKKVKTDSLPIFNTGDLATNKAYTIGRRGSYKDYVDLYFLLRERRTTLGKVIEEAQKRFSGNFSEKLFLQQLTYMDDITDFAIDFLPEKKVTPEEVGKWLTNEAKKYTKAKAEGAEG